MSDSVFDRMQEQIYQLENLALERNIELKDLRTENTFLRSDCAKWMGECLYAQKEMHRYKAEVEELEASIDELDRLMNEGLSS